MGSATATFKEKLSKTLNLTPLTKVTTKNHDVSKNEVEFEDQDTVKVNYGDQEVFQDAKVSSGYPVEISLTL